MSDQTFGTSTGAQTTTRDVAVEESKAVGHDAAEGARSVAQTAGEETQHVVEEAKHQAASLFQQVREDVTHQAQDQQQRAAGGLRTLAGELDEMAQGSSGSGMATGLARQASERVSTVAGWLERREPADVLEEVRRYARRNPGTFLAACAVVGLVGGRLTRGLRDEAQHEQELRERREHAALVPVSNGPAYAGAPAAGTTTAAGYGGRPTAPGSGITGAGASGAAGAGGVAAGGVGAGGVGAGGAASGDPLAGVTREESGPRGEVYPTTEEIADVDASPGAVYGSEVVETEGRPFEEGGDRR